MAAEPVAKERKLWRAVAMIEFVINGHLSLFASLEIILGVCGIAVTVVAWLLTLVL
jgi:hypothetical protein